MTRILGFNKKKLQLWNSKPVKHLSRGGQNSGGRNSAGRTTAFHRGGGIVFRRRFIDFYRQIKLPGVIRRIEYDPARSAFIALICYQNGVLSYILATSTMKVGQFISNNFSKYKGYSIGSATYLKYITPGTKISSISKTPSSYSIFSRSAGVAAQVLKHYSNGFSSIRLPSKEERLLLSSNFCTIGEISNSNHRYTVLGTAGVNRRRGKRPIVRGLAMNPIDHPHGGGDTKGCQPVSPWGQLAKGFRTVRNRSQLILKPSFLRKKKRKLFFLKL